MTKPEGNNEFGKYEKEFSRLMQEAVEKHVEENAEPLNIDYSFLNDHENVKISSVKKRRTARSFARVAVILIVFFCGVSVAMVTDMPTNASAWKAQMARRLYVLKEGFVSTDPDVSVNYTDENTITVVIDDFDKIEKGKNIMPELPNLNYIPSGWEFNQLIINRMYDDTANAIYKFTDSYNNEFAVLVHYDANLQQNTTNIDGVIDIIESEKKTICVWEDKIENCHGVNVMGHNLTIDIVGDLSSEEMILLANSMQ